ncbi:acid phosphatase (class A) [Novosphingobium sp. SG751A]|uniref:phosphatase PAP2 family protein n=1 Tax=Novosphingobium sp. SG751A TaxID=2587000 RepID=UPI0015547E82|nr:phosphatase PAP2 family protein [Novosphingobium sp. SG751A]NOW44721.1 acid phosphatase (class A) [Novosphingobium sp. SG751A]
MRRPIHYAALLALPALAWGGVTLAQPGPAQPGPALPPEYRAYLTPLGISRDAIAPAPTHGSPREAYDRAVFAKTRALEGSPRWTLAQADAGRGVMKAFSCAAGLSLTDRVPALTKLLSRYRTDLINATRAASPRPYQLEKGATCLSDKPLQTAGGTPMIQAAWGWTVATILAEALPERTDALMTRARAFGESAAICGFAGASEVHGGRDLGSAMLARARALPEFAADLAQAQAELRALAKAGTPAPEGCAAEGALTAPAF